MIRLIILSIFITLCNLYAESIIVTGKIIDKESKTPIPGATIRVVGTKKGSYSSTAGNFKQPLPDGSNKLKFSSFGYFPQEIQVFNSEDNILIELVPDTINLKGVEVIGNINADNIINRAIEKKNANQNKIKTVKGLLYSKITMELGGTLANSASSDGGSFSLGFSSDSEGSDENKFFVMENFTEQYKDEVNKRAYSKIIKRRQTKNLSPDQNILNLTNFRSFYDNEVELADTKMISPLNDDALDYYNFELLDKALINDEFIYNIKVIPNTTLIPTFQGTIKIAEDSYNLYEVDLQPSDNTAIPFIKNVNYLQKFEEVEKDLWYPVFMEVSGQADIDVVKGIMDVEVDLKATSLFSDLEINLELPDSLFNKEQKIITAVAPTADSLDMTYWENNSLRQIEPRELEMYQRVDSIVVAKGIEKTGGGSTLLKQSFWVDPFVNYNRVSSVTLGIEPHWQINKNLFLETKASYSYGIIEKDSEFLGNFKLTYNPTENKRLSFDLEGYTDHFTMGNNEDYPLLLNTVTSLVGYDYYDYYKNNGLRFGFVYTMSNYNFSAHIAYERHYSRDMRSEFYLFKRTGFRENPFIFNGEYYYSDFRLNIGEMPLFVTGRDLFYEINMNLLAVSSDYTYDVYPLVELQASFSIPLFDLGYNPLRLELDADAGYSDHQMYRQYQFRMPTSIAIFGKRNAFLTSKISEYGGTEYYALHGGINITDIWWRWLRLPTYQNRGLDLTLVGSVAQYKYYRDTFYKQTGNDYYTEVGFNLSRIPVFFSNVAFLTFRGKWGVGNLASGRFGWALSASLPF